jgi:general secretion pathway protein D
MELPVRSRLRRLMFVPVAATLLASAQPSRAQPATRGAPVLRTPPTKRLDPGGAPGGGTPAAGGKPGTPGAASDDPMAAAGVKTGAKEIDFKPVPGGYGVNFNLDDADLPELVKAIGQITGKRFIYGGKLRQIKATVYSPSDSKITANEAYNAFLSILATNGMTVIPHGRFLKIVETPGVVTDTTTVYGPSSVVPDEDRYITRLYRLAHIDATETATILGKFKSKDGDITVYPPGNLLIITETGSNIHRMMRILEEIDVGGAGESLWVEKLNYTSATELANKLADVLDLKKSGSAGSSAPGGPGGKGGGGGGASGPRVVADDRGNALIITATEPDYLRMLELIKAIDVKPSGDGEIHVLPLQHAGCKELSQTLNQILGTQGGFGSTGARPPGSTTGAQGSANRGGIGGVAGSGIDEVFEGRVRITCDEATNSIVTTSSMRDYAQLHTVINKLDRPRRQVYIEAVIMDVSIQRVNNWSVGYHGGAPVGFGSAGQGVAFAGNNIVQSINPASLLSNPTNLQALAVGLQGPQIPNSQNLFGTGISIPALGVVLTAMAQDGDTNVLATPHILALDNQDATISIGQNIPLQQNVGGGLGALAGAAGAGGAGALGLGGLLGGGGFAAPRQDVGTKIKVKPHVNDSDQIRLELSEEISDAGAPTGALGAIPINKRTAETQLVVRDQQTVVIGGLVREAVQNGETKIPILGDIPVLGYLFKQTQKTKTKSNLLLVLTPYVIRSQDDLRAIFERKMQERQEFIDRYFVFNEGGTWSPPKDYRRSNGLVEDIRQSLIAQEEKVRIEADAAKPQPKIHVPGTPIPLPHLGGGHSGGAEEPGAPAAAPAAAPAGRPRRPAGGGTTPRVIERRE